MAKNNAFYSRGRDQVNNIAQKIKKRKPTPVSKFEVVTTAISRMTIDGVDAPVHRGLDWTQITVVSTPTELSHAIRDISSAKVVGFDTEARPTRTKGESSLGPHLVQISTLSRAYLFAIPTFLDDNSLFQSSMQEAIKDIVTSNTIKKVGFGLTSDKKDIFTKFGWALNDTLDLALAIREPDETQQVGTIRAVLRLLGTHFIKARKLSMSNWSMPIGSYSRQMVMYAANDAHVALLVYHEWLRRSSSAGATATDKTPLLPASVPKLPNFPSTGPLSNTTSPIDSSRTVALPFNNAEKPRANKSTAVHAGNRLVSKVHALRRRRSSHSSNRIVQIVK